VVAHCDCGGVAVKESTCGVKKRAQLVALGVCRGRVIAPLLFSIYMYFVVQQAMAQMPEGCGVKLAFSADAILQRDECGSGGVLELCMFCILAPFP